jgi:acetyl-CoA carboxylase, biotin carboxylase subunit
MIRAIDEYQITGVRNTLSFGRFVMEHESFASGNFDTHFVSKYFDADSAGEDSEEEAFIAALVGLTKFKGSRTEANTTSLPSLSSVWKKNRKEY